MFRTDVTLFLNVFLFHYLCLQFFYRNAFFIAIVLIFIYLFCLYVCLVFFISLLISLCLSLSLSVSLCLSLSLTNHLQFLSLCIYLCRPYLCMCLYMYGCIYARISVYDVCLFINNSIALCSKRK